MTLSVLLLLFCSTATHAAESEKEFTVQLTAEDFPTFIKERGVRGVYLFSSDEPTVSVEEHFQDDAIDGDSRQNSPKKGMETEKTFFAAYEKSAEALASYGARLATVDCTTLEEPTEETDEFCNKQHVVHTFRNGAPILELAQEHMFDVDSIVSNILQIVLLREVPILQNRAERKEEENTLRGKENFIFTYQQAIGIYQHRIAMEVAFAYHGKVKFGLTTEKKSVSDLPNFNTLDKSALWLLTCKQPGPCSAVKYMGDMDLGSLSRWVAALQLAPMHDVVADGDFNPYEDHGLDVVIIFYDKESAKEVKEEATFLVGKLRGLIGILMVDVDDRDALDYGFHASERIPALAFQARGSEMVKFMPYDQHPLRFVASELSHTIKDLQTKLKADLEALGEPDGEPEDEAEFDDNDRYEEAVETQDDQVAEAVAKMKDKALDKQYIMQLTDVTFPEETERSKLLVVLFYLTFDVRSMAFLHSYVNASHLLAAESPNHLASVDCYDWTDVCGKQNITIYPTVRVYRKDHNVVNYKGLLGAAAIASMVKLYLSGSPLVLTSVEEAQQFLDGKRPAGVDTATHTAVLGLYEHDQKTEMASFKEAAKQSEGKFLYGLAMDGLATQLASQYQTKPPSLLVYKRHDRYQPYVSNRQKMTSSRIVQYVFQAALPIFPELTAANFPAYFAMKKPFVILFHNTTVSALHDQLGEIAESGRFPGLILAWMAVRDPECVAAKVLSEYDVEADPPLLAFVDHNKGTVHILPSIENPESVSSWIPDVLAEKVEATKNLKEARWKPQHPGYNFLKFMDLDAKRAQRFGHRSRLRDDTLSDSEQSPGGSTDSDDEAREELIALHSSRLFHHHDSKKTKNEVTASTTTSTPTATTETPGEHKHEHGEL